MTRLWHVMGALLLMGFVQAHQMAAWAQDDDADATEDSTGDATIFSQSVPDTIMFTVDELNEIQGRIAGGASGGQDNTGGNVDENTNLYLSAIMYFASDDWKIWVNGHQVGPESDLQMFEVVEITPDYVDLIVPLSAMGMRPIRIEPNQTFMARQGVVIEGRWNG